MKQKVDLPWKLQHVVWILCFLWTALCLSSCFSFQSGEKSQADRGKPFKSWLKEQPRARPEKLSSINVEKLQGPEVPLKSSVEVVWKIPDQTVDGFIIRYGFSKDNLSERVKIPTDQLDQYDDPELGIVFRYFLKEIPRNQNIFITLAAYQAEEESEETDVIVIAPQ